MTSFSIFLQAEGSNKIEIFEIDEAAPVETLVNAAKERGLLEGDQSEFLIFLEDQEEPLVQTKPFGEQGGKAKDRVILHRCRRIEVSVAFNAHKDERRFSPAATVARVKRWFVKEIGMSPVDASEHVLQLAGTTERPDPDTHIGTLVRKGTCSVSFTLVPRKRVEG
ncbi:hypothetical protein GCM10007881_61430 [Mesorhizobium huakuii]|nr:hypothetical protein GCM10007881_61430 [Mesorhizobium huakuii]